MDRRPPASVMAAVALAVSLWSLWRSRSARLQAAPFAHFATFHQSAERAQQYLVVGNHGPSEARDLSVTFSRGGKTWVPGWNGGEDSPFPIQALAPGNPLGLGCWGNWTEGKTGLAIATICLARRATAYPDDADHAQHRRIAGRWLGRQDPRRTRPGAWLANALLRPRTPLTPQDHLRSPR